jgi:hypothetical protein
MAILISALATSIGTADVDNGQASRLPLIVLFSSIYFIAIFGIAIGFGLV